VAVPATPDTVTGRVVSVNPKGVRLDGHADWLNFSRFAGDIVPPMRGQHVTVTVDRQGFVRAVEPADESSEVVPQTRRAFGATSVSQPDLRELRIIRQCVLKAAVDRAAGRPDVTTSDVIRIAEAFESWVLRPYAGPETVDAF